MLTPRGGGGGGVSHILLICEALWLTDILTMLWMDGWMERLIQ